MSATAPHERALTTIVLLADGIGCELADLFPRNGALSKQPDLLAQLIDMRLKFHEPV